MPLILAIEPDRRQAAHLTAVVKRRVSAELILVGTTEGALDAIGSRVPDLVLVPALLSPTDDAALAGALRVIAAAANVQVLTIPVLSASQPAQKSGGVLSALRRGRKSAEPEGCDPTVFADQIASYLERAAQERADAANMVAVDDNHVVSPFAEAAAEPDIIAAFADTAAEAELVEYVAAEAEPVEYVAAEVEPVEYAAAAAESVEYIEQAGEAIEAIDLAGALQADVYSAAVEQPQAVPIELAFAEGIDPALAASADESVSLALEEAVRALFWESPATELPAEQPMELVAEPPVEPVAEPPVEPVAESPVEPVAESPVEPVAESPVELVAEAPRHVAAIEHFEVEPPPEPLAEVVNASERAAVDELIAALHELPLSALQVTEGNWPSFEVEDPESVLTGMSTSLPDLEQDAIDLTAELREPAAAETIESEVYALDDAEPPIPAHPLTVAPAAAVAPQEPPHVGGKSEREWVALIESLRSDVERLRTERADKPAQKAPPPRAAKPKKAKKPAQDEWGFFDPEQCGFAALLAKLDEVTEDEASRL